MNFDRNTVVGFLILAALFMGYFYFNSQQQSAMLKERARQDSIAQATQPPLTAAPATDTLRQDTSDLALPQEGFQQYSRGTEELQFIETPLIKVAFTNKGGQPKYVELKNFQAPDSNNVRLASSEFDQISYTIIPAQNTTAEISDLFFQPGAISKNPDGSTVVSYQLASEGRTIVHQYVIKPDNYMMDFNIIVNGVNQLFSNNTLNLRWQNKAVQLQKDLSYERQQSQISYFVDDDYDYTSAMSSSREEFTRPISWVGVKQQFFNSTIIAKNKFSSGFVEWTAPPSESSNVIVQATAHLKYTLPAANDATIPMSLYFGPTDYKILKQYGNDMEDMVNLGSGIFAFVKYINRFIILPVFDFLGTFTSNYGIVILLLTLFIRLAISPLTYSSYLSGAKMKALRPEIEQLKVKYGTDQQQISMEQMKLFREAGVNPLGGCIPGLLQIPIFFALYSFFNANVALRGANFLWADDLSQYDSILDFGFNIPLFGDHLSLFTLTAVVTSFLISIYSLSMTPDQSNPVLKYMPYFFPIILLFVFNNLPAGLTWYYTVSNIITLILQFIIQNYIINHDKILANIEANRKKPKTKSKWQERIEQMQEQQKTIQSGQKKNKG
jgi:YidC/Oxa1 family membrane protein insertase